MSMHSPSPSRQVDLAKVNLTPLDMADPMIRFMVDLRDAIGRETQARAHEILRGPAEAAWIDVGAGLMKLVDPHKPEAALAHLHRIYMSDPLSGPPKPAAGPTRDELKLDATPDGITGLDRLKNLIDPNKPETIVKLAELYLKSQAEEFA